MDAGSYSKEVISVVEEYSDTFYIRSKQTPYYNSLVNESTSGWRRIKLLGSNGDLRRLDVRSVETDEFIKGKTYRVVLYRYEDGWAQDTMFQEDEEMKYRYPKFNIEVQFFGVYLGRLGRPLPLKGRATACEKSELKLDSSTNK